MNSRSPTDTKILPQKAKNGIPLPLDESWALKVETKNPRKKRHPQERELHFDISPSNVPFREQISRVVHPMEPRLLYVLPELR